RGQWVVGPLSRIGQQAGARAVAPVASSQQEIEQFGAASVIPVSLVTGLEPHPILLDGCPRSIRGDPQVIRDCAVDVLGGDPLRDAVAEQDAGAMTLAQALEP